MMDNMTRKLAAGVLGRENAGGGREWYVKDYQGSLVMTIVNDAVGNVIAYEPYGSQKLLQANGDMPSEQYTGKEYVGRLGLYYFGARFFDQTFAMWLTPDPAGQYLNPYTCGGDPINAVDLYGLWKLGVGITIGWDHGFTLGAGVALDFGDEEMGANLDFGYTRNFGNHSNTWSAQAGGSLTIFGWNMGANLGISYNNKTGTVLNYGTNGGYGGWGIGFYGANYWDTEGEYLGGTIGANLYYKNAYVGYEHGYSGMQGRGVFAGVRGYGFHAEYSQNGGFDWGGSTKLAEYYLENNGSKQKWVGVNVMGFKVARYDHDARNDNPIQKDVMGKKRKDFEQVADEKGLVTGHYSALASALHEENPGLFILSLIKGIFTRESPKRTIDKMWMGRESIFSFLYGWFLIPSVEGLFYPGGEFAKSPSYNYGNVFASHFFLDVVPHWVFDD